MLEDIDEKKVNEKAQEIFDKVVKKEGDTEVSSTGLKFLIANELFDDAEKEDVVCFCILSNFIDDIYSYKEKDDRSRSIMY